MDDLTFSARRATVAAAPRPAEADLDTRFRTLVQSPLRAGLLRYLSANPALARMLGYASPAELIASITDIGQQLCVDPASRFEGRDLAVTTDFRDLFGEVLARHLGATDLSAVFPGFTPDPTRFPGAIND